ncbi:sensor histidine kinase [Nocardioides iriomotensis]|uniref:histidine kinase n=1 Tax=Nocardioides iriomotensis TaxID=715784 RepID=A0A4Q5J9B8_9ACTN|nr:HAMP domain-containing sensor histidine kinase [Nocardioides iriomotensis]RYU14325.1 HAMP domain-containing histidine kinase [Nocardioides iriomotensis]
MSSDHLEIVLIATAWSTAAGVVGLAVGWLIRHRSLGWIPPLVAVVAVVALLAGMVGTARAMFLSDHDFGVVVWVSVVAGVVATAFATALGYTLVRTSRRLREDTRRFGEVGRFAGVAHGPAEFQALSAELARTSDRLEAAREAASRADASRRDLVSWVAHDLRTPLAGLRAMTEALEDGLAEEPARYHRQMRGEVDRMVRMVDDLFELSRIHAGVLRLEPECVALGDLVSEAIAGAEIAARDGRVHVGGSVEQGLVVTADPAGLTRVVRNLVTNAIRHTPADGTVEIRGRSVPDGVELAVTDGCGGIASENLPHVFDVAWRGESARTPEGLLGPGTQDPHAGDGSSGAGLGLAIVKGIVEAHHGRVHVANTGPGCRFAVVLPV